MDVDTGPEILQKTRHATFQIRELTNSSEKVITEYLSLYETYKVIGPDRLAQITSTSIEKLDSKKGGLGVRQ